MKLLRDFFRFRSAGRSLLGGRRDVSRSIRTITVPEPLIQGSPANVIDLSRRADQAQDRSARQESASPKSHGHLQLLSSH